MSLHPRTPWVVFTALFLASCATEVHFDYTGDTPEAEPPAPSDPPACEVTLVPAGDVPVDPCTWTCDPGAAEWDVVVEWEAYPLSSGGRGFSAPAIAHLSDDDGDGVYGAGDQAHVLLQASDSTGLVNPFTAWAGDGSSEVLQIDGTLHADQVAPLVADVDGDGSPEIVVVSGGPLGSWLTAMEPSGAVLWESETFILGDDTSVYVGACQPTAADLDGDGTVEVFCDVIAVDGRTGATRFLVPPDVPSPWRTTTIADLDGDGSQEIVVGRFVLDSQGAELWHLTAPAVGGVFPAVVQLDTDPQAELLFSFGDTLEARDHLGSVIWTSTIGVPGDGGSTPCTGDFDGDGVVEIGFSTGTTLAVLELDGSVVWTRPVQDASSAASCSAFDFDADGRAELAFADEESLSLYCGPDGMPLYTDLSHQSGTSREFPIIADVDGDGAVEIVVGRAESGARAGVVVYGQRDDAWAAGGEVWPQLDYRGTNHFADGTVPAQPVPSWLDTNLIHSRPTSTPITPVDVNLANPGLELMDSCTGSCELDGLSLAVRVTNVGAHDMDQGMDVAIYAVESYALGESELRLIGYHEASAVASGRAGAAFEVRVDPDDVGAWGLMLELVADDGGPALRSAPCAQADDRLWIERPCQEGGAP